MKGAFIFLIGFLVCSCYSSLEAQKNPSGMVRVQGGIYKPFLITGTKTGNIKIAPFYLDEHAVTNAQFLEFVKANPQWAKSKVSGIFADGHYLQQWSSDYIIGNNKIQNSPVTNISWFAANAYCKWKGKRLPNMAEWEYAANAAPVGMKKNSKLTGIILQWYDHPTPKVLPAVESTYKNKLGLYDMHGLVWEWVEDFNSITIPKSSSFYCAAGALTSTNKEDYAAFMRYAFRENLKASYTVGSLGFRCASDVKPQKKKQ